MTVPRMWDLDDLAGIGDLAEERRIGSSSATSWRRYPDFPAPLITVSTGPIYSRAQVRAWQETRWPPGAPGSERVRYASDPRQPPGQRRDSYDDISADLRRRLAAGEFPVGSRLPARPQLAAEYGVRERFMARPLADLVREGLLGARRGSGTYVTKLPRSDHAQ